MWHHPHTAIPPQRRLPCSHAVHLSSKFIACSDGFGICDLNYKRAHVFPAYRFAQRDLGRFISRAGAMGWWDRGGDGSSAREGRDMEKGLCVITYWFSRGNICMLFDDLLFAPGLTLAHSAAYYYRNGLRILHT